VANDALHNDPKHLPWPELIIDGEAVACGSVATGTPATDALRRSRMRCQFAGRCLHIPALLAAQAGAFCRRYVS